MPRISNPRQSKVTDLQVAVGVEQQVGRFQITVQHISGVNEFQPTEDLVCEVACVIVRQFLSLEQFEQISFHQPLHNVHIPQFGHGGCSDDVLNVNNLQAARGKKI